MISNKQPVRVSGFKKVSDSGVSIGLSSVFETGGDVEIFCFKS